MSEDSAVLSRHLVVIIVLASYFKRCSLLSLLSLIGLFLLFRFVCDAETMSCVAEENMTSSHNDTPITVTFLWRHPVPSSAAWWPCLVCLSVAAVGVNVVTWVVLMLEKSLQTTLYTYLTSLAVCDVIGMSVVTPIAAARTSFGQSQTWGALQGARGATTPKLWLGAPLPKKSVYTMVHKNVPLLFL